MKAAKLLYERKEYEDALLIHIMSSSASIPNEIITLIFEDFEDQDFRQSIFYYANKENQRKRVTIADDLFNQVMEFKNFQD